jgi:hypothetical protein
MTRALLLETSQDDNLPDTESQKPGLPLYFGLAIQIRYVYAFPMWAQKQCAVTQQVQAGAWTPFAYTKGQRQRPNSRMPGWGLVKAISHSTGDKPRI